MIKFFKSLFLGFYFYIWEIWDFCFAALKFYWHPRFALTDILLHIFYPFTLADRICYNHLRQAPEDRVQVWYGETSLISFQKICREADLNNEGHLFELGSGRGRLVFWAQTFLKCKTTGIEINPKFVKRAQQLQRCFGWKDIEFIDSNFLDAPLEKASHIYLYGTAFEPPSWPNLLSALKKTEKGTKIITVSKSLAEWGDTENFRCIKTLWVGYVWGKSPVYIQERC